LLTATTIKAADPTEGSSPISPTTDTNESSQTLMLTSVIPVMSKNKNPTFLSRMIKKVQTMASKQFCVLSTALIFLLLGFAYFSFQYI
jgi:hypothetical protein